MNRSAISACGTAQDLRKNRKGRARVALQIQAGSKSAVRSQWMPEPDWLVVEIENKSQAQPLADLRRTHRTRAFAERRFTYRSSGRLSEIAGSEPAEDGVRWRQAAHEFEKRHSRVIKGYYDLLLAGRWAV